MAADDEPGGQFIHSIGAATMICLAGVQSRLRKGLDGRWLIFSNTDNGNSTMQRRLAPPGR
jgi:hypothetical protein